MQEFLFDVKFFASFSVIAANVAVGRTLLTNALASATLKGGSINGEPLVKTVSIDDEIDLLDGENLQFDVPFFSTFGVEAASESEARTKLSVALEGATLTTAEVNDQAMIGLVSIDGEFELLD